MTGAIWIAILFSLGCIYDLEVEKSRLQRRLRRLERERGDHSSGLEDDS